ncbi:MAG TPA: DUF2167 domain-containing protein [Sphingomicrobium sp.]|jgi:uncharacterized membrane-anchored protein|nr:DUF2167 domain-containing protein [Sphingomicrobium sp.]
MRAKFLLIAAALSTAAVSMTPAYAQNTPSSRTQAEIQAAWQAAAKSGTFGPAQIRLLDQATLNITDDEVFIPAAEANRIMAALGNSSTPERFGLVTEKSDNVRWMVDVTWIKEGYVRDGDAKEWQADAMLEDLKEGTERGNAERLARGIPALDVTGWVEKPAYDSASHRLVWSLSLQDRGAPAGQPQTINYNTYALGREGYFSLDLITGSDTIGTDKLVARNLLGTLNYRPGKRYEDFSSSTDKVAAYGLGALVGVVAVKKLGLLGLIGVFLLKIWKLAAVALVGAGAAVRRFFGRQKEDAA